MKTDEFLGSWVLYGPQKCDTDGSLSAIIRQGKRGKYAECQICRQKLPDSHDIVAQWERYLQRGVIE